MILLATIMRIKYPLLSNRDVESNWSADSVFHLTFATSMNEYNLLAMPYSSLDGV